LDYAVTILGSGTCVSDPARYPASYLIEIFSLNEKWLLDLGSGCLQRLVEVGVSPFSIDRVFITHTHPDHIASYLPYIQTLSFTPGQTRRTRVEFYCSAEVERVCTALRDLDAGLHPGFPFGVTLLASGDCTQLGQGVMVRSLGMTHSAPTLGFRFEVNQHIVAFGADSGVCENLVALCRDVDLAVFDCSFPAECGTVCHAATDGVGKMAREAKARKIVLSHMYPALCALGSKEIIRQVVSEGYSGEIVVGADKLRVVG
jgi:ribonuclease BN (tRNA processing enzyme)